MTINSYRFGTIVVDGIKYDSDLIIHCEEVLGKWWRAEGHHLSLGDLQWVLARKPRALIIGQGYFGRMRLAEPAVKELESRGFQVEAAKTGAAVERFNTLLKMGIDVAGAFHLTC